MPRLSTYQMPHRIKGQARKRRPVDTDPGLGVGEGAQLGAQVHAEVVPPELASVLRAEGVGTS